MANPLLSKRAVIPVYYGASFYIGFIFFSSIPLIGNLLKELADIPMFYGMIFTLLLIPFLWGCVIAYLSQPLGLRKQAMLTLSLLLLSIFATSPDIGNKVINNVKTDCPVIELIKVFIILTLSSLVICIKHMWFANTNAEKVKNPIVLLCMFAIGGVCALWYLIFPDTSVSFEVWSTAYTGIILLFVYASFLTTKNIKRRNYSIKEIRKNIKNEIFSISFISAGLTCAFMNHMSIKYAPLFINFAIALGIYLLATAFAFLSKHKEIRPITLTLQLLFLLVAIIEFISPPGFILTVIPHIGAVFLTLLICQKRLAGKRISTQNLLTFIMYFALGALTGVIFVSLIVGKIFALPLEYPIMLAMALLCRPAIEDKRKKISFSDNALRGSIKRYDKAIRGIENSFTVLSMLFLKVSSVFEKNTDEEKSNERKNRLLSVISDIAAPLIIFAIVLFIWKLMESGLKHNPDLNIYYIGFLSLLAGLVYQFSRKPLKLSVSVFLLLIFIIYNGNPAQERILAVRDIYGTTEITKKTIKEKGIYYSLKRNGAVKNIRLVERSDLNIDKYNLINEGLYYPETSIAKLLNQIDARKVAVLGAQDGTLLTFARLPQQWSLYFQNKQAKDIAEEYFGFDCQKSISCIETSVGNIRTSFINSSLGKKYDLIIINAHFTSALPKSMISTQAFGEYLMHLSDGGIIAIAAVDDVMLMQDIITATAEEYKLAAALNLTLPAKNTEETTDNKKVESQDKKNNSADIEESENKDKKMTVQQELQQVKLPSKWIFMARDVEDLDFLLPWQDKGDSVASETDNWFYLGYDAALKPLDNVFDTSDYKIINWAGNYYNAEIR